LSRKKIDIVIENIGIFFDSKRDNPKKPKPPVIDLLIATKLSQNTTDKTSHRAYLNLKESFKSWDKVADAPIGRIKECIRVCGLTNTKAADIKKMLQKMRENYGMIDLEFLRDYPDEKVYEELLQYDGIGVKTISCVLAFSLGRDVFPVDTHVHRILNRLGIVKTNTAEQTFEKAKDLIPGEKKVKFHTDLIKFGRNICKSQNPLCNICFIYKECEFEEKVIHRKKPVSLEMNQNNFIILENI